MRPASFATSADSSAARPSGKTGFRGEQCNQGGSTQPTISTRLPSFAPAMLTRNGSIVDVLNHLNMTNSPMRLRCASSPDDIVPDREKYAKNRRTTGKLGILLVGMGAVSTTTIAGVLAVRRGLRLLAR